MAKQLSRSEHLNIMTTPEVDIPLRALALSQDATITVIVRRALDKAFKDDAVFQTISAYAKSLTSEQQAEIKKQMQNTAIPPMDRIPGEIQNILKEFGNE